MRRRSFLKAMSAAAAPLARAASPVRLGYDTYSIRAFRWKALEHIEYAARQKLDAIQISSLGDFESLAPAHLAKVRDAAGRHGIRIDGGIGCICPTSASYRNSDGTPEEYIPRGLRTAKALGAAAMRCFVGSMSERRGKLPVEAHMEAAVKVLQSVRPRALEYGVKIAIENHNGDLSAAEVRTIIEEAGPDLVGSNLDTGNPMWLLEDPMLTLETLAPYVVTSHFRDSAIWEIPGGIMFQWVALGDGSIDMPRLTARFHELCPRAAMQLEIITGRPPQFLPCYGDAQFWKGYPKVTGAQFARFAALAKQGHPFAGAMMTAGPSKQPEAYEEALKLQQRIDLERSFEYARKKLDAGIRWREG